jgi:hypothetical protein
VVSLGDDGEEGVRVRDEQGDPALDRARLFVAGPVLDPRLAGGGGGSRWSASASMGADWVKIRVDDGLGQRQAMPEPVYRAVPRSRRREGSRWPPTWSTWTTPSRSSARGRTCSPTASATRPVDAELIGLMRERGICLNPTLTRELSTFVYGSRPAFFDDPFFLREADPEVIRQLEDPERQRARARARLAATSSARSPSRRPT